MLEACSKRECYIRSGTTPKLGFSNLLLRELIDTHFACTVDSDTKMVSGGVPRLDSLDVS